MKDSKNREAGEYHEIERKNAQKKRMMRIEPPNRRGRKDGTKNNSSYIHY